MANRIKSFVFLLCLLVVISGCASTSVVGMARPKERGPTRVYNIPIDNLWEGMPDIIKKVGLVYNAGVRGEGCIWAGGNPTMFREGEDVSICMTSLNTTETSVEVVTTGKSLLFKKMNIRDWATVLFKEIEAFASQGK
ncbi:MAG: hypothetical protein HQL22_09550 [Candidatus Omnitrophica bacterium]|nr:hypothetical protein [Candidatus Omnitrophota bacterium]